MNSFHESIYKNTRLIMSQFSGMVQILVGAYSLGALIFSYFATANAVQPALFWINLFTQNFQSPAVLAIAGKVVFFLTLLTMSLPAIIFLIIGTVLLKKRSSKK